MTKHRVAAIGELEEGGCKIVRINGAEIAVFLVDGEHRAYRNLCPHAGAPLCTSQDGGNARYERGGEPASIRCPWHGWEFDLHTGAFLRNPRCKLDDYPVEIADGAVNVCW